MRPLVAFVLCFFLLNAFYLLIYLPDLRSTQQQQQQQAIVFTLPPLNRDLNIAHPLTSKPPPSTTKSPHDPHAQLSLIFLSTAKFVFHIPFLYYLLAFALIAQSHIGTSLRSIGARLINLLMSLLNSRLSLLQTSHWRMPRKPVRFLKSRML